MSALAVSPAYSALLAKFPPRVIRSEEQNETYLAALYELEERQDGWSAEESELAELFTLLIEDFEEKHYQLPKASPGGVLTFLMDQHGLVAQDLIEIFGDIEASTGIANDERELTRAQIQQLSAKFGVSPELFF